MTAGKTKGTFCLHFTLHSEEGLDHSPRLRGRQKCQPSSNQCAKNPTHKKWKILCQQQQNYVFDDPFVLGGKFGGGNFPVKSLAGRHLESHLILGHALNLNFHYQRYQYLWVLWCSFLLCILGPPLLQELPWLDN